MLMSMPQANDTVITTTLNGQDNVVNCLVCFTVHSFPLYTNSLLLEVTEQYSH